MPYIKTLLDNSIISAGIISLYILSIGAIFFDHYLYSFIAFAVAFGIHTNKTNQYKYIEKLQEPVKIEETTEVTTEVTTQVEITTLKKYLKKFNSKAFVLANLVAFLLSKLTTLVSKNFLALPIFDFGEGFEGTAHILNTLITYVPLFYIGIAIFFFLKEKK